MGASTVSGLTSSISPAISTESKENAARLQSIDEFYRSGEVILLDDFESGLGGRWVMEAGGNVIGLSALQSYSGSNSLRIQSPLAINGRTVATRSVIVNGNDRFGLETKVTFTSVTIDFVAVECGMVVGSGSKTYTARWRYEHSTNLLQILQADGTFHSIDNIRLSTSNIASIWNVVKLIVDARTGMYASLKAGQKNYDLSAINMPFVIDMASDFDVVQLELVTQSLDGVLANGFYDDVILTRAEE